MESKKPLIVSGGVSLLYLSAMCAFLYFASSNIELVGNWFYWSIFLAVFPSGFLFVMHARKTLALIWENRVQDHFEIYTKKGGMVVGDDIKLDVQNNVIILSSDEFTTKIPVENIRFTDVVTRTSITRLSTKKLLDKFKEQ